MERAYFGYGPFVKPNIDVGLYSGIIGHPEHTSVAMDVGVASVFMAYFFMRSKLLKMLEVDPLSSRIQLLGTVLRVPL